MSTNRRKYSDSRQHQQRHYITQFLQTTPTKALYYTVFTNKAL